MSCSVGVEVCPLEMLRAKMFRHEQSGTPIGQLDSIKHKAGGMCTVMEARYQWERLFIYLVKVEEMSCS